MDEFQFLPKPCKNSSQSGIKKIQQIPLFCVRHLTTLFQLKCYAPPHKVREFL